MKRLLYPSSVTRFEALTEAALRTLVFDVPGFPQSQGSARAFIVKGRPRITSDNQRLLSWRRDAMVAAREAMERCRFAVITGPVAVSLSFYFGRPAGHFGTGRNQAQLRKAAPRWKLTQPDLDKLARGALDALMGAGVIRDDRQVVELVANKEWSRNGVPSTTVVVNEFQVS